MKQSSSRLWARRVCLEVICRCPAGKHRSKLLTTHVVWCICSCKLTCHAWGEATHFCVAWPWGSWCKLPFGFLVSRAFPIVCFGLFYLLRYITTHCSWLPHTAPYPCRSTRTTLVLIFALDNPFWSRLYIISREAHYAGSSRVSKWPLHRLYSCTSRGMYS